jgi:sirohydrochlorin ferrochelatase
VSANLIGVDHGFEEHPWPQAVEVFAEIDLLRKRSFVTINNSVSDGRQALARFDAQAY